VLSETNIIYQYYYGLNEQVISLPNLTVTNNITLDSVLANPNSIVTNNASSYYICQAVYGLFFFNNITNNVPAFNFG